MRFILAIDPGDKQSAYVIYDTLEKRPTVTSGILDNNDLLLLIHKYIYPHSFVIEISQTVFETCLWIGRFIEANGGDYRLIYRKDVKMYLCGSMRAKESNIRQAIIDRYGGKEVAIGKKKTPGPLYGFKADMWQALAVALYAADTKGINND